MTRAQVGDGLAECVGAKLAAVVCEHTFQLPAGRAELAGDAAGELGGLLAGRVATGAADELGPGEGGRDVDRGQLPDGTLGAGQTADVEAVDADQLARPLGLDVSLRHSLAGRLVGSCVTGQQQAGALAAVAKTQRYRSMAGTRTETLKLGRRWLLGLAAVFLDGCARFCVGTP